MLDLCAHGYLNFHDVAFDHPEVHSEKLIVVYLYELPTHGPLQLLRQHNRRDGNLLVILLHFFYCLGHCLVGRTPQMGSFI